MVAVSFDPGRPLRARDLKVMALARRLLLGQRQQARCQERLRETLFGLARCLLAAIDAKDAYTSGHSRRVARVAVRLGRQFGLGPAALGDLYLAALLHDVGKIGLRTSVLKNPGRLSAADMAHVREHPVIGDGIVSAVPSLAHLRPVVRHHHERYDGRGYPDGLAGLNIPLFARIVAVADACDAMTSDRPYRPALAAAEVDAVLVAGAGSQWDPKVVGHFLACRAELYPLFRQGPGDSVALAVEEVVRGWGEE
jgi:HD-GYP domain-containing protein (c-di-GMP phosphodiesterase class II)